jgi:AraC-like DNA-binding protein
MSLLPWQLVCRRRSDRNRCSDRRVFLVALDPVLYSLLQAAGIFYALNVGFWLTAEIPFVHHPEQVQGAGDLAPRGALGELPDLDRFLKTVQLHHMPFCIPYDQPALHQQAVTIDAFLHAGTADQTAVAAGQERVILQALDTPLFTQLQVGLHMLFMREGFGMFIDILFQGLFLMQIASRSPDHPVARAGIARLHGPARFHPPTNQQLTALLKSKRIALRNRDEIARKIARLPEVSIPRLVHLGRALWSLCHAYSEKEFNLIAESGLPAEADTGPLSGEPRITFTLVEEEKYSPFELIQLVRQTLGSGDVEGARRLWDQNMDIPLNPVVERDAVLSAKYRLITATSAWAGMIIDLIPYEGIMMVLDQYTRKAHQTHSIPELTDLVFEGIDTFTRLVRRYSTKQYPRQVRQVLQYIQANLAKRITLGDLAELTGLSSSYLSRLIKKETGASLLELVDGYRIEKGKYLLLNTDSSILQIAELTGFHYQNHFSRCFRKYTGMTPTRFRRTAVTRTYRLSH